MKTPLSFSVSLCCYALQAIYFAFPFLLQFVDIDPRDVRTLVSNISSYLPSSKQMFSCAKRRGPLQTAAALLGFKET